MKIKDLSFIAEIDQENANNVNGGTDNPFADAEVSSSLFMEQTADMLDLMGISGSADMIRYFNSFTIEPTVYQW